MSVSKKQQADAAFCAEAVRLYRTMDYSIETLGKMLGATPHTVSVVVKRAMSAKEFDRLKRANYSRSKTGENNPMMGVRYAAERILRQGRAAVWNGSGYTHEARIIVAKSLGLKELPEHWSVHHIDGDKTNDSLDNLALVTKRGHQKLHKQLLGRLYRWEKEKFGTSVLREMRAILRKG